MSQDATTTYTCEEEYSHSISSTVGAPSPIRLFSRSKPIGIKRFERFIVSANISLPTSSIENATESSIESPRILTNIQAYELALNALRTFEDEWKAYVQEEARLLSIFDEENDE